MRMRKTTRQAISVLASGGGLLFAACVGDATSANPSDGGAGADGGDSDSSMMSGDTATGETGNPCGAGTKLCAALCIATDIAHGCEGTSCDPCLNGQNSTGPACAAGKCNFACNANYAHCSNVATDGCETAIATDKLNCGACGHSCLGGDCLAGVCQPIVLASTQNFPTGIAVDATNVYWTNYKAPYVVRKIGKDGTVPGLLASSANAQDVFQPISIATDGTNVYWVNYDGNGGSPHTINQIGVNGANLVQLGSGDGTDGIAIGNGVVWWANLYAAAKVGTRPLDGGAPSTFATYTPAQPPFHSATTIAVDATHVYWTDTTTSTIYRQPVGAPCVDGACTVFVTDATTTPVALALDTDAVFWVDIKTDTIQSRKKDGTGQKTLATSQHATSIATDGTNVYWTLHDAFAVRTTAIVAPTCDGAACKTFPQTIPVGYFQSAIAVDATAIYWASQSAGAGGDNTGLVVKLAK